MSPALLCLNSSVQAPQASGRQRSSGKHGAEPGSDRREPCTSKALILPPVCACVCVVLLFCLRCKKEYSFQLSYTEAETSESGLAKLMCRKALGVNLKRWVEAVMHMIKVKHAAYTENC